MAGLICLQNFCGEKNETIVLLYLKLVHKVGTVLRLLMLFS